MNSYLKTAVYAALGDAANSVLPWELQFYVTEAQRAIAMMLPWQMVPEIIEMEVNPVVSVYDSENFGLHDINGQAYYNPGIDVISISVDPSSNIGDTHTSPVTAIEVSPSEFFYKLSDYAYGASGAYIYCLKGNKILANFKAGRTWGSGSGNAITITYKKAPNAIPLQGAVTTSTLRLAVTNSVGTSYVTTDHKTISDYSGVQGLFVGGSIVCDLGTQDPLSVTSWNKIAKIIDITEVDVGTVGAPDLRMRIFMDITLTSLTTDVLLMSKPSTDSSVWPIESSYLSSKWTLPIVDHALSALWLKLGDANRSALYNKSFIDRMNSMGATAKVLQ